MARVPAGIKRAELIELLDVNEQLKVLTARKSELVDKAKRAHLDFIGTETYGPVVLTIAEARKFDPDAFAAAFPIEKNPGFYAPTVNRKAIAKEVASQFVIIERRLDVKRAGVKPTED